MILVRHNAIHTFCQRVPLLVFGHPSIDSETSDTTEVASNLQHLWHSVQINSGVISILIYLLVVMTHLLTLHGQLPGGCNYQHHRSLPPLLALHLEPVSEMGQSGHAESQGLARTCGGRHADITRPVARGLGQQVRDDLSLDREQGTDPFLL